MSAHGRHLAAAKKMTQKINKQENELYYQKGAEQHTPRTEQVRSSHRKLENQKF